TGPPAHYPISLHDALPLSWKVAAGPYDVHVTGTAFDVSWSNQTQAFDLRMETGAVIVMGPLAAAGIPLRAGQHMFSGMPAAASRSEEHTSELQSRRDIVCP